MVSPRKIVYAVVEAVRYGDKIKPVQVAVRRVFYRYGLTDPIIYNKFAGIVYNVFRHSGLADHIFEKVTGIKWFRRNQVARSAARVLTYVLQLDPIIDEKWKNKFYVYVTRYVSGKLGLREREFIDALAKLKEIKWSPVTDDEHLMIKYLIHPGLYRLLEESFKMLNENLDEFLQYTMKRSEHVFRVNALKASRTAIYNYLKSLGLEVELGKFSSQAIRLKGSLTREVLKLIETGVLTPQDEASMIAVELMPLRENMIVADLCAAPGNKTSYIAEKLQLKVKIHAFDINRDRIKRMRALLERTGTANAVKIYQMDARRSVEVLGEESVDLALVDPPCSSTGALARNPEVRWRYTPRALSEINKLQKQLLDTAIQLVKPGGYVMYTVCSVLVSEGEGVVKDVLEKYQGKVVVAQLTGPFKESPLLRGTMRSYPHIHGTTGFYYALLKKEDSTGRKH